MAKKGWSSESGKSNKQTYSNNPVTCGSCGQSVKPNPDKSLPNHRVYPDPERSAYYMCSG